MEALLRLEVTGYLSREKVFVGQSIQQLSSSPDWGSYSKVILKTDEGEGYVAGDDSGLTLEAECPYASQAIADAVLAELQGKSYKPYEGSTAYITPAAEIGDGMTSDGFYSGIYSMSRKFSKVSAADIAAPSDTEVQHEIQYEPQSERKFTRKMKEISSALVQKVDSISAWVQGDQKFEWSLMEDCMEWKANNNTVMKISSAGLEVTGTIKGGSVVAGSLTVDGASISPSLFRSGVQWPTSSYGSTGYTNGGWSLTGGGYGFNFNDMQYSASAYARPIHASSFRYNGTQYTPKNIVVSGVMYTVLAVPTD